MNQPVLDQDLVDLIARVATQLNVEAKDITSEHIFAACNAVLITSTNVERIIAAVSEGDTAFSGYEYVNAALDNHFGAIEDSVRFDGTRLILVRNDDPGTALATQKAGKKKQAADEKAPDA